MDIAGATGSSYTLAEADEGKAITVSVSFTDDAGHEESLTSATTGAVTAASGGASGEPHGLTAVASDGAVVLTWKKPEGQSYNSDYQILRHRPELGEAEPMVYVEYTGTSDTSYTDTKVEPGVLYVYRVKAVVNFLGDLGEASDPVEVRTSEAAPAANSPATGTPSISGTARVGQTLTADTSGIADEDGLSNASFSYQWKADSTDIAGATDSTYTLADSDEGKAIVVTVSFTDDAGNAEELTSAATAAVAAKPNSPATGAPSITGTAQVGETLTAYTSGVADEDGLSGAAFTYQWQAANADIAGATNATYTLTDSEEGKAITVQVSFTDDAGHEETLGSAATAAVESDPHAPQEAQAANNAPTGAPTLTGTAQVGETLTAEASGIADADGLDNVSFSYQWVADSTDIAGATGSTYTLADADEGRTVTVRVSFTDDAGYEEELTSAATGAVAGLPPPPLTASLENAPSSHDGETRSPSSCGSARSSASATGPCGTTPSR